MRRAGRRDDGDVDHQQRVDVSTMMLSMMPEGVELVFLADLVVLSELATVAVEYVAGQVVSGSRRVEQTCIRLGRSPGEVVRRCQADTAIETLSPLRIWPRPGAGNPFGCVRRPR